MTSQVKTHMISLSTFISIATFKYSCPLIILIPEQDQEEEHIPQDNI